MTEKKTSEAQLAAIRKYKQKVKRFTVEFSPTEKALYDHLQSQPVKQTYIKNLIRRDMENKGE